MELTLLSCRTGLASRDSGRERELLKHKTGASNQDLLASSKSSPLISIVKSLPSAFFKPVIIRIQPAWQSKATVYSRLSLQLFCSPPCAFSARLILSSTLQVTFILCVFPCGSLLRANSWSTQFLWLQLWRTVNLLQKRWVAVLSIHL